MQRRARRVFVVGAALAAAAVCGLTAGCSAELGGAGGPSGSSRPGGTANVAQPGRYSGLPEPCGAVPDDTLRELLPGGDAEAYEGETAATFDSARRVRCAWHTVTADGSHRLSVDLQRIVSYDPAVSDDDEAETEFEERAADAGITVGVPESPDDVSTPPADPLASRALDGIGHVAFLDDRLTSVDPGERRDLTLAFRNANVIVTVNYVVSTNEAGGVLDNALLQQRIQQVARQLAGGFDG
ncbi:DUF3558 domain-containing protein [Streptomyces sp. NBC_01803]|uniref:DUF3558 domain-containing protein n=1 Tax=Streptomyces sp. NBC_01803 TaxID=2975946 RepID=UPI002DD8E268|nr:DUF3558 domain-containing protein [Streptomyces sp. NBC_01803]WSA44909.1 DUF3558 domain-containing protein [Streptomyces sp. NBC_01803]